MKAIKSVSLIQGEIALVQVNDLYIILEVTSLGFTHRTETRYLNLALDSFDYKLSLLSSQH